MIAKVDRWIRMTKMLEVNNAIVTWVCCRGGIFVDGWVLFVLYSFSDRLVFYIPRIVADDSRVHLWVLQR